MSTPALVWLAVGLVTVAALTALLVGLVRHVLLLGRTLERFQSEVQPIAEEISREADRAASRARGVQEELPFGRR